MAYFTLDPQMTTGGWLATPCEGFSPISKILHRVKGQCLYASSINRDISWWAAVRLAGSGQLFQIPQYFLQGSQSRKDSPSLTLLYSCLSSHCVCRSYYE